MIAASTSTFIPAIASSGGLVALGSACDTFAEAVDDYFGAGRPRWPLCGDPDEQKPAAARGRCALTIQGALALARARNDGGIERGALSDLAAMIARPPDATC
jgi:hypothetical protein